MDFLLNLLSGKKTYVVGLIAAALTFALQMGWIDQQMYEYVMTYLGIGGAFALRSAVKKAEVRSR